MIKEPKQLKEMVETAISKSRKLKEGILRAKWENIAGELSKKSEALYIKNRVLYVAAENSMWIQHLNFKKLDLLNRCNDVLGDSYLVDIFFKAGKISLENKFMTVSDVEEEYDPQKIELSQEEIGEIRIGLVDIEDLEIREKLFRIQLNAKKKEKFLLAHGYKICSNCHTLHNSSEELCTVCENKLRQEIQEKVFALFRKNLESGQPLRYQQALQEIQSLSFEEFELIKKRKLDKIYKQMWNSYRKGDRESLAEFCREYFIIELESEDYNLVNSKAMEYIKRLERGEISED